MECRKWEEVGLLYCAQEVGEQERREYEAHLAACTECTTELEWYRERHTKLFTPENLAASPSARVDAEILRLCSDPRKKLRSPALFPSIFRKAFVPAALFLISFFAVGYIMLNVQNAGEMKAASIGKSGTMEVAVNPVPVQEAVESIQGDSLSDSLQNNQSKVNFAKTRGTIKGQDAIPVDLKNK